MIDIIACCMTELAEWVLNTIELDTNESLDSPCGGGEGKCPAKASPSYGAFINPLRECVHSLH